MALRTLRPHAPVLALLLLAGVLGGCAAPQAPGTEPHAGVRLPSNWSGAAQAAAGAASPAAWWRRFGDPTLSTLIVQALQANTDVETARAALRQSRALAQAQAAALGPSVDASASAQRSRIAGSAPSNALRAGLDASWAPDAFGARRSASDAAEFDAQASAANLGNVQVTVAAEVALAYITLRATEARLAIAQANLETQQETLQITQWRVQAGLATSIDAEQARAAVEQTRAQRLALQSGVAQSRQRLALLTGRTVGQLTLPADTVQPQAPADLALAFPAETLRQRADVRAAELRVRAAAQRIVQADAARYPSFQLSGSLGLSALTLSGLTAGGAAFGSLLAGVAAPVFDGGAATAQLHAQQAAFDQARAAYRATVLGALGDVEDALAALQGDRGRVEHLRSAAEAAANAALLARQRYASGLIDFQTVLETQRTQLSAQDSVASGIADLAADHVRLYQALGGGWSSGIATDPTALPQDDDHEPR